MNLVWSIFLSREITRDLQMTSIRHRCLFNLHETMISQRITTPATTTLMTTSQAKIVHLLRDDHTDLRVCRRSTEQTKGSNKQ